MSSGYGLAGGTIFLAHILPLLRPIVLLHLPAAHIHPDLIPTTQHRPLERPRQLHNC